MVVGPLVYSTYRCICFATVVWRYVLGCDVDACALRSLVIGGEDEGWDCFALSLGGVLLAYSEGQVVILLFFGVLYVNLYSLLE